MIFRTEHGSVYEVDEVCRNIRRLSGARPPKKGVDGEWQPYVELQCSIGRPALVQFQGDSRTMITTRVTEIDSSLGRRLGPTRAP